MALVFFVVLVLIGYYARAFGTLPKFRPWLIEEAKKRLLISEDQAFIPGVNGVYPAAFETFRTTRSGLNILLRPAKIGICLPLGYLNDRESSWHSC